MFNNLFIVINYYKMDKTSSLNESKEKIYKPELQDGFYK